MVLAVHVSTDQRCTDWSSEQRGRNDTILASMLISRRCKRAAHDGQGGCRAGPWAALHICTCPQSSRWPLRASEQVFGSIEGAVTPSQQTGWCADGSVQREGQALARQSDLRAMQAQPCFHAMMPGCLWGVWSSLPHTHVDIQNPTSECKHAQRTSTQAFPRPLEHVCVISRTPANRLQLGLSLSHKASSRRTLAWLLHAHGQKRRGPSRPDNGP